MFHVMFDIDGTLVQSYEFDEECYLQAVFEVLGEKLDSDWAKYKHVTDSGILSQYLESAGYSERQVEITEKVKTVFIEKISSYLKFNPAQEIPGASNFISILKGIDSISLSIATGGWLETALLKLESAGIDISGIPVVSSNDHFSRVEIMKIAMQKANVTPSHKLTYFGDAAWDKRACNELGYDFVLVGNRIMHDQQLSDLNSVDEALGFIGLVEQ